MEEITMTTRKNNVADVPATKENGTFEKAKYWLNSYAVFDGTRIQIGKGMPMDDLEDRGGEFGTRRWLESQLAILRDRVKPGERKIVRLEVEVEIYAVPETSTGGSELTLSFKE